MTKATEIPGTKSIKVPPDLKERLHRLASSRSLGEEAKNLSRVVMTLVDRVIEHVEAGGSLPASPRQGGDDKSKRDVTFRVDAVWWSRLIRFSRSADLGFQSTSPKALIEDLLQRGIGLAERGELKKKPTVGDESDITAVEEKALQNGLGTTDTSRAGEPATLSEVVPAHSTIEEASTPESEGRSDSPSVLTAASSSAEEPGEAGGMPGVHGPSAPSTEVAPHYSEGLINASTSVQGQPKGLPDDHPPSPPPVVPAELQEQYDRFVAAWKRAKEPVDAGQVSHRVSPSSSSAPLNPRGSSKEPSAVEIAMRKLAYQAGADLATGKRRQVGGERPSPEDMEFVELIRTSSNAFCRFIAAYDGKPLSGPEFRLDEPVESMMKAFERTMEFSTPSKKKSTKAR